MDKDFCLSAFCREYQDHLLELWVVYSMLYVHQLYWDNLTH